MAYQPLRLPPGLQPVMQEVIRDTIELQLRDIHCMLRLPLPEHDLDAGCNFACAHFLLAILSGISVVLYQQDGPPGKLLKGLLDEVYWKLDPPHGISPGDASKLLYEEFRNPLTHVLGLSVEEDRARVRKIAPRKSRLVIKKWQGLTEEKLERREASGTRPASMSATLTVTATASTLLVDGLYWGLRRTIEELAADTKRMQQAAAFLGSAGTTP